MHGDEVVDQRDIASLPRNIKREFLGEPHRNLHGGMIELWGSVGQGAHFVLTLPCAPDQPFEAPAIEVEVADA